jgi:hypothetical protein
VRVLDASTSPPRRYAVSKDNIIKLIQPGNVDDQLTEILRNGARALLARAVEAEVSDFLDKHADLKTGDGRGWFKGISTPRGSPCLRSIMRRIALEELQNLSRGRLEAANAI